MSIIYEVCVAQTCCRQCPLGKESYRLALDCNQYIKLFPAEAVNIAQRWKEQQK